VGDLGSQRKHYWHGAPDEQGETIRATLEDLLDEHPAPLVAKKDNGPGFRSEPVSSLLDERRILALDSPPYLPSYNGSIEAANGSLRRRTDHRAASEGRAGEWCEEDLEWALRQMNEMSRPWGACGPTPEEMWREAKPIDANERESVWSEVIAEYEARLAEGTPLLEGAPGERIRKKCWREAIQQVLIAREFLEVRRRVVHPHIRTKRTARIP